MRLFFAIVLNEPVRRAAATVIDSLQQRLARAKCPSAVKWVERENLHVTLRFLGEVRDDRARSLLDSLREPVAHEAFELSVGGAGAFPAAGSPRVLWLGTPSGAPAARAVFDRLERRLVALGFERESRPYTPHLTLGRVREIDRAHARELREWLVAVPSPLESQQVTHVTLYRSHLSSSGPRYEVEAEVPLR